MPSESRPGGLGRLFVRALDALLCRFYGVYEFSQDPACILRVSPARAKVDVLFTDGTQIVPGDPVAVIHFWNERMPLASPEGVDLRWAREMYRALKPSFQLLAAHLPGDPKLAQARAVCGEAAFVGASNMTAAASLLSRLGFEIDPPSRAARPRSGFATFWENTYTWMLVWTYNPATLRGRTMLDLERHWLWMSRSKLDRLYGAAQDPPHRPQVAKQPQ